MAFAHSISCLHILPFLLILRVQREQPAAGHGLLGGDGAEEGAGVPRPREMRCLREDWP